MLQPRLQAKKIDKKVLQAFCECSAWAMCREGLIGTGQLPRRIDFVERKFDIDLSQLPFMAPTRSVGSSGIDKIRQHNF
jgi:hypothetical protein